MTPKKIAEEIVRKIFNKTIEFSIDEINEELIEEWKVLIENSIQEAFDAGHVSGLAVAAPLKMTRDITIKHPS